MLITIPMLGDFLKDRLNLQSLDDAVDRLHYFVTTCILLFFAFMVGTKQHFGSPIECMNPAEFKDSWANYVHDFCFIEGKYMHPPSTSLSMHHDDDDGPKINYYQWVPFFLAFQALLFHLPNWMWTSIQKQSGNDIKTIVSEAKKVQSTFGNEREIKIKELSKYMQRNLGKRLGGMSIYFWYLVLKIAYLLNVIAQFVLMSLFLETGYTFWGIQLLNDLLKGEEVPHSGIFPRTILCDVKKMENANVHRHSVQCVIMLNMLNEKIFLFLWFWMVFVTVATFISLLYHLVMLLTCACRIRKTIYYLNPFLETGVIGYHYRRELIRFGLNFLGSDGLLILRFIESHAGTTVAQDLTMNLWQSFLQKKHLPDANASSLPFLNRPPFVRKGRHHMEQNNESIPFGSEQRDDRVQNGSTDDTKSTKDEGFYDRYTDPNSVTASALNVTVANPKSKSSLQLRGDPQVACPVKTGQSLV